MRLWEVERNQNPRLTTLQAGLILNFICNMNPMDKLGMTYGFQAAAMAHDLGIFGNLDHIANQRQRHSYGFTAWCSYAGLKLVIALITSIKTPRTNKSHQRGKLFPSQTTCIRARP